MKSYRYKVVDVFTTEALEGNALAVFPDASGLDATTMQKIARELNLAETAFVLPATRKDCAATFADIYAGKGDGLCRASYGWQRFRIARRGHCSERQQRVRRGREDRPCPYPN